MDNIFSQFPTQLNEEVFSDLLKTDTVRIEKIISKGHSSPETGWYDQDEHEWVIVLEGNGIVEYDNGQRFDLKKGDYLNIPSHQKHKVVWTDPEKVTLWLAVFYR